MPENNGNENGPAIVIPAAGMGRRMKTAGPKCLVKCHKGEPLILRQIRLCREVFADPYIVVVLGYEAERIQKILPSGIHVVINAQFENTNVAHSLRLGMSACPPWLPLLILYGDLVFNKALLKGVNLKASSILVDQQSEREAEVGVTVVNGKVTYFSYGLPLKWSQVATLMPNELDKFSGIMSHSGRHRHYGYEILNEIVEGGGHFLANTPKNMKLVEIDCAKDIDLAKTIKG